MKQKNVILMVVAVGCGLVAAFLTSQMNAKGQVEQIDVLVAAKDLPVGTVITKDDVDKYVKVKRVPKDGLPPAFVTEKEQLLDKRLSRPLHAEETFNPQDLLKGGAITLPPGYGMVSLPVGVGQAAAGFVGPGSRVDVIATLRLSRKLHSFPLLINMLVVAVNTQTTIDAGNGGAFPNLTMVSFAVKEKEALILALAKTRGCTLELLLRHPETSDSNQKNDKLDEIVKLLSDDRAGEEVKVIGGEETKGDPEKQPDAVATKPEAEQPATEKPATVKQPEAVAKKPEPEATPVAPAPTIATVKVLVAKRDVAPNTLITNDLIAEAFEWKELPKDYAADALTDFSEVAGKAAFKSGVAKSQWVTRAMLGDQAPKPGPRDEFALPKPAAEEPAKPELKPEVPVQRNHLDVAVHTTSGTVIHRYEEVEPGKWKKVAELTQGQAAKNPNPAQAPKPGAGAKID
jgi:Flp pilus assembly protein CpaB